MHFCATYKMANFPARTGYRKYDISVAPDALMPYQFCPILVRGGRLALESKNQVVERRKGYQPDRLIPASVESGLKFCAYSQL